MRAAPAFIPGAHRGDAFRSLYVHVPFCRHKCGYCDFNAYAGMDGLMPSFVEAVLRELDGAAATFEFGRLDTVYFGGGTPSLLPAPLMSRLIAGIRSRFEVAGDAEVTLEANPASTDPERLRAWVDAGVNRLSIGVQGFDPRALAVLERRTDGRQAERAVAQAREAGIGNLSVDLIYAVPFQTVAAWTETLRRAVELGPDHLSCYCLSIEGGTLLDRRRREGRLPDVTSDEQWRFLDRTVDVLHEAGYERYEVSSWCRPGRESRHNRAYWECRPVYGAGPGAHSYATDGRSAWRWWNVARPREYIERAPAPALDGERLDARLRAAENLMLGLRTARGVGGDLARGAGIDPLIEAGLLERSAGRVRPTRRGMDLHNQVALAVL